MWCRTLLRRFKRGAAWSLESVWNALARAVSRTPRRTAARWTSAGGQRVLVVAPHPDDETIGCVGTILSHVTAGDAVCVAVATDGRRSTALRDPAGMASLRLCEAIEASRSMGVQRFEWLGLREGEWTCADMTARLRQLIESVDPHIIYAPSRVDFHPEHRGVAHALGRALATRQTAESVGLTDSAGFTLEMRVYQIQVPLGPLLTSLVTDVRELQRQCAAVFAAHGSQAAGFAGIHRQRRYDGSWCGLQGDAEVFWQLSPGHYQQLHRGAPQDWPRSFRGIRDFPLTDPLAYLRGWRERRALGGFNWPGREQHRSDTRRAWR